MLKRKAPAGGRGAEGAVRADALDRWSWQETAPLPDDPARADRREAETPAGRDFAAGWWILPGLALSIPAWLALVLYFL